MRIATPFFGITWVWYNELQYQRWKYATPFRGDYVESGTINRPLRLRNQRGKIYKRTPTYGVFLRKYTSTNTPKGVFADSSHPYHNQKQLVLMYEIWRICDTNNTNRTSGK